MLKSNQDSQLLVSVAFGNEVELFFLRVACHKNDVSWEANQYASGLRLGAYTALSPGITGSGLRQTWYNRGSILVRVSKLALFLGASNG